jgi:hypothetical protein
MAARSRPRGGQRTDEYDEERVIWNSIKQDGRRVDQLLVRYLHFHRHQFIVIQGFRQLQYYLQYSSWTIYRQSCVTLKVIGVTTSSHPSMAGFAKTGGTIQTSGTTYGKMVAASMLAWYGVLLQAYYTLASALLIYCFGLLANFLRKSLMASRRRSLPSSQTRRIV